MLPLIEAHRAEIAALCRQYGVRELDVFGSAARETDFDLDRSDVDLLVTYEPDRPALNLKEYFGLTEQLSEVLGRKVDLVMSTAVRNPYIRADIDRWKKQVYVA
jgi:predicted nucleotidyltransferase